MSNLLRLRPSGGAVYIFFSMKKILFFIAALSFGVGLTAQNYSKYFTQNIHEKGKLYFILPMDMEGVKENTGKAALSYDFTYLDSEERVSLLSTCSTPEAFLADSLHIVLPSGKRQSYPIEKIYNEKKRSKWNSRNRCYIDFSLWQDMYKSDEPYTLILTSSNQGKVAFKDSARRWKKKKEIVNFVQTIIEMNRN